jgi:hypothetical protein
MTETKLKKNGKEFNPTLGSAYSDPRFGDKAIKFNVTADAFDAIMKNVQVGSTILLRGTGPTKYSNEHYFVEVLPPYEGNKGTVGKKAAARAASTSDLD